jgi:large subunit ribosomal protein L29
VKTAEIRDKDEQGLRTTVRDLQEELFKLKLQNVTHQLENPIMIRKVRRDLARCRTILREREGERERQTNG